MNIPTVEDKPMLTIEEAGKILGLKRATAYAAVSRGTIPIIKISGHKHLVPTAAIRQMLGLDTNA